MIANKSSDYDQLSIQSLTALTCQGDILCTAKSIDCYFCSLDDSLTEICSLDVVHNVKTTSNNFMPSDVYTNLTNVKSDKTSIHLKDYIFSSESFLSTKSFLNSVDDSYDFYKSCRSSSLISFIKDNSSSNSLNETLSDIEDIQSYDSYVSLPKHFEEVKSNLQNIDYLQNHFTYCLRTPSIYVEESITPLIFTCQSVYNPLTIASYSSINNYLMLPTIYNSHFDVMTSMSKWWTNTHFVCSTMIKLCLFSTWPIILPTKLLPITVSSNKIRLMKDQQFKDVHRRSKDNTIQSKATSNESFLTSMKGYVYNIPVECEKKQKISDTKSSTYVKEIVWSSIVTICYCSESLLLVNTFFKALFQNNEFFLQNISQDVSENIFENVRNIKSKIVIHRREYKRKNNPVFGFCCFSKIFYTQMINLKDDFKYTSKENEVKVSNMTTSYTFGMQRASSTRHRIKSSLMKQSNYEVQLLLHNSAYLCIFIIVKDILHDRVNTDIKMKETIKCKTYKNIRSLSLSKSNDVRSNHKESTKKVVNIFDILTKRSAFGKLKGNCFKSLSTLPRSKSKNQSLTLDVSEQIFLVNDQKKRSSRFCKEDNSTRSIVHFSIPHYKVNNFSFDNKLKLITGKSWSRVGLMNHYQTSLRRPLNTSSKCQSNCVNDKKKSILLKSHSRAERKSSRLHSII